MPISLPGTSWAAQQRRSVSARCAIASRRPQRGSKLRPGLTWFPHLAFGAQCDRSVRKWRGTQVCLRCPACSAPLHSLCVSPRAGDLLLLRTKMAFVLGLGVTDKEEGGRRQRATRVPNALRRCLDIGSRGPATTPFAGSATLTPMTLNPAQAQRRRA